MTSPFRRVDYEQSLIFLCKVSARETQTRERSWFAIALAEIRTRRILREKEDCEQSRKKVTLYYSFILLKIFQTNKILKSNIPYPPWLLVKQYVLQLEKGPHTACPTVGRLLPCQHQDLITGEMERTQ